MIYSILVGALIGWIASRLMGGKKGLLRYLILGVAGSAVGNFLAGRSASPRATRSARS